MPEEIILHSPYEVWWAEVGTAFPLVDAVPAVGWTKFAAAEDQSEAGVSISLDQSIEMWRGQLTAVRDVYRTEEGLTTTVEVTTVDAASMALALGKAPTDVANTPAAAGTAGTDALSFSRGPKVRFISLLIRGASPALDDPLAVRQYELPKVFQNGAPQLVHSKTGPALLALEFISVQGPAATTTDQDLGRVIDYTAKPTA